MNTNTTRSYKDLIVWQKARKVTIAVFASTKRFPAEQRFGLALQMQRASMSIGSNIAEGFGRWRPRDKAHFYTIAMGSADELQH
jgi:four helix bundle protein